MDIEGGEDRPTKICWREIKRNMSNRQETDWIQNMEKRINDLGQNVESFWKNENDLTRLESNMKRLNRPRTNDTKSLE